MKIDADGLLTGESVFRRYGVALVALLPVILPLSAGAAVINWAHATYDRMYVFLRWHFYTIDLCSRPAVQRKFMAYITDLTHVLDIIFVLTASRDERKPTIRIIKTAIVLYQMSQRRWDVHTKIKELSIGFFGGCDVNTEMESIVKSRYITDGELKEKVEMITSAELEGDEDWDAPQSHGGNLVQ